MDLHNLSKLQWPAVLAACILLAVISLPAVAQTALTKADRIKTGKTDDGQDSPYIHRQTMANAMRFSTVELADLESRIAKAADRTLALETELFADLCNEVTGRAREIALAADALARLDVASALGALALERRYVRPTVDASRGTIPTTPCRPRRRAPAAYPLHP